MKIQSVYFKSIDDPLALYGCQRGPLMNVKYVSPWFKFFMESFG